MKLHISLFTLFAVAVFCGGAVSHAADAPAATAEAPQAPKLSWVLEFKEDKEGTPRGKVVLSVNGKKTTILEQALGNYAVIEPANYKDKKIPANAVTACGGWWAGSGEDFYVVTEKGKVLVYQRTEDEQGVTGKYKLVKTLTP